jgi:integrase
MKRHAMMAVQRCLNWAAKKGYIPYSPIAKIDKPQGGRRDYLITPEEYERILSLLPNQEFRDLLMVSWETGCRPQEVLIVEAHHVDLKHARWIFELENSKGKKRQRVVYLTDRALEMTKRLMLKHPDGPLFRTEAGGPWTAHSVNCQFVRLQHRMGKAVLREKHLNASEKEVQALMKVVKRRPGMADSDVREIARARIRNKMAKLHAPKYCLYLFRHAWMTRLLQANVDPITVSTLAGHVDTSMLARRYQHLAHDPKYLLEKVKRATG